MADPNELSHWVEIFNMTRGYGGIFNYKTYSGCLVNFLAPLTMFKFA